MNDQDLIAWGRGTPRTFRVYWALHELEVSYRSIAIKTRTADMDRTDFLAVSPGKKIPAIQDGELKLTESGAIVFYLYRKFSDCLQIDIESAEVMRWSLFALMELDATTLYVMRRHQGLPEIYGEAPGAVASSAAYFERQITVVANALADDRRFIVGSSLSPADIFIVSCCDWALAYDLLLPKKVANYHLQLQQLPSYQQPREVNENLSE